MPFPRKPFVALRFVRRIGTRRVRLPQDPQGLSYRASHPTFFAEESIQNISMNIDVRRPERAGSTAYAIPVVFVGGHEMRIAKLSEVVELQWNRNFLTCLGIL